MVISRGKGPVSLLRRWNQPPARSSSTAQQRDPSTTGNFPFESILEAACASVSRTVNGPRLRKGLLKVCPAQVGSIAVKSKTIFFYMLDFDWGARLTWSGRDRTYFDKSSFIVILWSVGSVGGGANNWLRQTPCIRPSERWDALCFCLLNRRFNDYSQQS